MNGTKLSQVHELNRTGKFNKGPNAGTRHCYCCGKRVQAGRFDEGTELCDVCLDSAGAENEHSDTNGDHYGRGHDETCPTCMHVGCIHELKEMKTMTTGTNGKPANGKATTPKPAPKPRAKATPKPEPQPEPVVEVKPQRTPAGQGRNSSRPLPTKATHSTFRYPCWLAQKRSTGEWFLAYTDRLEGSMVRRGGHLHATREAAQAEADTLGNRKIVKDIVAARKLMAQGFGGVTPKASSVKAKVTKSTPKAAAPKRAAAPAPKVEEPKATPKPRTPRRKSDVQADLKSFYEGEVEKLAKGESEITQTVQAAATKLLEPKATTPKSNARTGTRQGRPVPTPGKITPEVRKRLRVVE